jgi:hypothetical protein
MKAAVMALCALAACALDRGGTSPPEAGTPVDTGTVSCHGGVDCARHACALAKLEEDLCNPDVPPGAQTFPSIKRCAGDIAIVASDATYYYYRGSALYAVVFFPDQINGWVCDEGPSSLALFPDGCADLESFCAAPDAGR